MDCGFVSVVPGTIRCFCGTASCGFLKRKNVLFLKPSAYSRIVFLRGVRGRKESVSIPFSMKISEDAVKLIVVTGNNIELTEALHKYVEEKVGKAILKYIHFVVKVEVHLSVAHNPSIKLRHTSEVTVFARKHVLRASETAETMYAAIDLVSDITERKLQRYKERLHEPIHGPKTSDIAVNPIPETDLVSRRPSRGDEEEWKELVDKYSSDNLLDTLSPEDKVVKRKSFPVPRQTVAEAVLCLEYIDHDFYVFRNSETGEVNIVYRRNHGGVGLIVPERES
ncbi:Light-repressed protein A [Galdieria sulphuraria]|uniref:Plastid-specific ribosomal protein PSRP-1 n=1 Tax=Galdieria sulphuraria TaxID=130081 RepID=M2VVK1_GALSU|nr:plastid-specific ribosomal protein PSRP-1 precursor [Galdieria sulphuraria]EME27251.1 plastid-specific ribosomal protein PSRP-1 precursor [Galdieria sulphuraria]GJD07519.1 Light-repressed protein A [Galdieria sulphuraria]|eukprot:XP_005703771.1 plastid-specific ribosomal protein PSRP-1 precursor [Galdieria sulphuraria]